MKPLNLGRLHALVVEDNVHMSTLIRIVLKALGVGRISVAEDGADAFKYIKSLNIDFIITDWNMSPLDGIDLARLIRTGKDSPDPFLPIIMLTGHTEMNRVFEARDAGVDEFIAKPFSAKAVYMRVENIVLKRRPFVKSMSYFGPDRRRQVIPGYRGPKRRESDHFAAAAIRDAAQNAKAAAAASPVVVVDPKAMSQTEVAALLGHD
ncbi:MAG: response regulator [Alphaproteobacteria bacterium]|nr:response regulator [Alphaproteobacteria bacterium]